MVKHSQSFQNNRFAMSLQNLKKDVRYEDMLEMKLKFYMRMNKHENFL